MGEREGTGRLVLNGNGLIMEPPFRFDVVPVPKERPRVVPLIGDGHDAEAGKSHMTYTPIRTKAYTRAIRGIVEHEMRGTRGFSGPIKMTSIFVFNPRPADTDRSEKQR